MSSPPKFKFTIVASFQDPLTRQIAESVRIERGRGSILNSTPKYSRCCVPRLRIDMEGWKQPAKGGTATVQEKAVQEVGHQMNALEEIEASSRRMESKRKGEERKFPKLEGWGPESIEQNEVMEKRIE